ncbi:TspO/MBR family protein [Ligilactobacillus sp. Marseille-Q7487]|uniref:TspO/MBR family protein n=1 Tax=Ligilactobacillus sp. Marseille-Q7487 TaxID=3022128 RepID=UPI0015B3B24C|nr:TspO/MBR family protein [Ligilactobacillus sp. Marseille-Q7487]
MQRLKRFGGLIVIIIVVEGLGGLSALFAGDIKQVYANLVLPPLAPPNYLFGIVWPLLYLSIAVSFYLFWQTKTSPKALGCGLYFLQMLINFIWSIVFFSGSAYWLGFGLIIILDLVVAYLIYYLKQVNRWASWLLWPYLLWILFASYLTLGVAWLN